MRLLGVVCSGLWPGAGTACAWLAECGRISCRLPANGPALPLACRRWGVCPCQALCWRARVQVGTHWLSIRLHLGWGSGPRRLYPSHPEPPPLECERTFLWENALGLLGLDVSLVSRVVSLGPLYPLLLPFPGTACDLYHVSRRHLDSLGDGQLFSSANPSFEEYFLLRWPLFILGWIKPPTGGCHNPTKQRGICGMFISTWSLRVTTTF